MEAADLSETFVTDYQIERRNISEDSSLRSQFCANLKTTVRKKLFVFLETRNCSYNVNTR